MRPVHSLLSLVLQKFPSPGLSTIRSRLVFGSAWALFGKGAVGLSTLAVNALLVRLLQPREVGGYYLILSIATAGALLGGLGLNQAVVRVVAESMAGRSPSRARAGIVAVLKFGMAGAVGVGAVLVAGGGKWLGSAVFNSPTIENSAVLIAAWVVVLVLQTLISETFRGFHSIGSSVVFGGLCSVLISILIFSWMWLGSGHSDLSEIIRYSVLAGLANGAIAGAFLYRRLRNLGGGGGGVSGNEIMNMAWPVLVGNLTLFVLTQSDIWIVGAFRPASEVALYGAAVRLVALVYLIHSVVGAVVPPLIAELNTQGRRVELQRALQTVSTVAGAPALAAGLLFIFSGEPILGGVFGDFYRDGATVLAILSVGQVVNVLVGSCGITLVMTGHQREMMMITLVTALVSVSGALWVVRDYGILGVAGVSSGAWALQNVALWLYAGLGVGIWTNARLTPNGIHRILSGHD